MVQRVYAYYLITKNTNIFNYAFKKIYKMNILVTGINGFIGSNFKRFYIPKILNIIGITKI